MWYVRKFGVKFLPQRHNYTFTQILYYICYIFAIHLSAFFKQKRFFVHKLFRSKILFDIDIHNREVYNFNRNIPWLNNIFLKGIYIKWYRRKAP